MAVVFLAAVGYSYLREKPRPLPPGVRMVEIDLSKGFRIEPVMASDKANGDLFAEMVERLKPYAAINGTFYDENLRPLGDVVIGGKLVNRGHYRTAIGVRTDGTIEFRHRASGRFNWSGFNAGLASGPRLVHAGKIACDPVADGFGPGSVTLSAQRSGVGITADNRLLLVTTTSRFTLAQFAGIMLELECTEAMNLDGGGACALHRDGDFLELPGLPMTNILAVYQEH